MTTILGNAFKSRFVKLVNRNYKAFCEENKSRQSEYDDLHAESGHAPTAECIVRQGVETAAPSTGHRRHPQDVLQEDRPAGEERRDLTQHHVRIGVSRPSLKANSTWKIKTLTYHNF